MDQFKGKVVIVTGSTSGIGRAAAIEFARQGALVAVTGRNAERLAETVELCKQAGSADSQVFSMVADLINDENITKLIDAVIKQFGTLHVLVNNAGIAESMTFEESDGNVMDNYYRILLRAPWELTRLSMPHLLKTKGCVVNVSGASSAMPITGLTAYATFKAALDHFTRTVAREMAPTGVRVNTVNPGATDTGLAKGVANESLPGEGDQAVAEMVGRHPIGRLAQPEEIAKAILYLASDDAGFVTGSRLLIDGGFSLHGW